MSCDSNGKSFKIFYAEKKKYKPPTGPGTARASRVKNHVPFICSRVRYQWLEDVRRSEDVFQSVKDRLCMWPTGDEILSLLNLLRQDQLSKSLRKTVSLPPQPAATAATSTLTSTSVPKSKLRLIAAGSKHSLPVQLSGHEAKHD